MRRPIMPAESPMSFIDPFDPLDAFMYDEFLEPAAEHQCVNCERLFGEENVVWSEEHGCYVFTCPGCGCWGVME